ncbi:MAG TPA: PQQ-binding-like beta-propeller repeat protein [Blastocatellia bacterium]|nr:PQQ-binding-like beta-propeller repeat protein [Blastocatellia bacterium]
MLLVLILAISLPVGAQGRKVKRGHPSRTQGTTNERQQEQQRAEYGATSTSVLALPFKRLWQHLTDSASMIPPTIDRNRILLPLSGGSVICLDIRTGSLLWSSEPGGSITAPILPIDENRALVVTRKLSPDGSDSGASMRVIDSSTGLTLWAHDYPRAFTSPAGAGAGRLYAGCADGSLYAIGEKDGEVLWRAETQDVVRGQPLVTESGVYFGSDDGAMRAVEPATGKIIWKLQTGARVACPAIADDKYLFFGSGDGYAYAVNRNTGVVKWRSRTGAAIEAPPVFVGDRLLVASFDNFVYCLSRATGDRAWKRRLENRISAAPIIEGDANLVAPLRGDYIAVFLNADGRRVNIYQLETDFEIVAAPSFSSELLVLATNKGLVVAAPVRAPDSSTAQKK